MTASPEPHRNEQELPAWLAKREDYVAPPNREVFVGRNILSITSVLAQFRLDDGRSAKWSASAPMKILLCIALIVLNSLSSNFFFTLVLLAGVLVRACLLPAKQLQRVAVVAFTAAALAFVVMLPAIFLGQNHSSVLIATKTLVSSGLAMTVVLSTPFNELTAGLRAYHVPSLFIMTIDLTLKNIVRLGQTALEVLTALKLRSVGRDRDKTTSMGGITGSVLLKTRDSADATHEAMVCRGFEGEYLTSKRRLWKKADIAWAVLLAAVIALFVYTQGVI